MLWYKYETETAVFITNKPSSDLNISTFNSMRLVPSFLLLMFSLFQFTLAFSSKHPTCHSKERSALLQFKESFIISRHASDSPFAYPKVKSWKIQENGSDCCSWDGVKCDEDTGHVIGLNLNASCLYGSVDSNSSLFHLVHLQELNLANNDFNGSQIPSALGNLSELTALDLSNSLFFGNIPSEISKLSKLTYLALFSNYNVHSGRFLKLKMPDLRSLVQNLTNLEFLGLGFVDMSFPIPNIIANFSSLKALRLLNGGLHGEFPDTIFQLPNLQFLEVVYNPDLTGHLPASIGNLHSLDALIINSCNFSGVIPFSLGNLSRLTILDLGNNSFRGQIPSTLANLTQSNHVVLDFNNLSVGTLSWLDRLTKLRTLGLQATNLHGDIPSSLGKLIQLSVLSLGNNYLTGEIPSFLTNLTQIDFLDFSSNNLSGTVDLNSFLTLKRLRILYLSSNNFVFLSKPSTNGTLPKLEALGLSLCSLNYFPHFLQKQNQLIWLDLALNNLHGKIPSWMWSVSTETLELLDLSHNFLTGLDQPPDILPWSHLRVLDLSSNMLQGSLPVPPFSTIYYSISNNSLAGNIPPSICKVSSLQVLDLSGNNLNGLLHRCLGNFSSSLSILNLESNNFCGTIPQTWVNGSRLRMLSLGKNKLQGEIPTSIAGFKMLEVLDLSDNHLVDTFPSWLGTLPGLKILILRQNRLHGKIGTPGSSLSFRKLQILDLSSNDFTGNLPVEYFRRWFAMQADGEDQLKYMQADTSVSIKGGWVQHYFNYSMTLTNKGVEMHYEKILEIFMAIDLSCNKFEGEIPEFIGNLKGLRLLNLSNNILSGLIPSSIGNLEKLEALDLSQNKLYGEIPQKLVQLNFLALFNVSHNHLTGPIPVGNQFNTFQNNSFDGNSALCGVPLSKKCGNVNALPAPASAPADEPLGLDWKFVVIGYGSGFVVGVVIGHIVTKRKHDWFMKTFRTRQQRTQRRTWRRHGN